MKLKKTIVLILALALALSLTVYAAEDRSSVVLKIGSSYCALDGEIEMIDPSSKDVTPIIIDSRTMLPIRKIVEHFGGKIGWNGTLRQVSCTLGEHEVVLTIDSPTAMVDGEEKTLDVPPTIIEGRTLVPVRFVSENLKLKVGWEGKNSLVVVSDTALPSSDQLLNMSEVQTLLAVINAPEPVEYNRSTYTLPSGTVTANVVTVNLKSPKVRIEAHHVDNTLAHTAKFSDIVASSDAKVIINANYFEAYKDIKDVIGHLMIDGEFIYADSGVPALGFAADNTPYWGEPSVFVNVVASSGETWAAYTVNTLAQSRWVSVLYTPARGSEIDITCDGHLLIASGGYITDYRAVTAGTKVAIPSNGWVMFMGDDFTSTHYFKTPQIGMQVELDPYLFKEDPEGFNLDEVVTIVSGAPRLVKDGAVYTELHPGFEEERFTTMVTPRTAVGTTADGKLIIVNALAASVQNMRELMLHLGCVDATCLDGGGSTAMYYDGQILTPPGRELTSTLHIFVD